MKRLMTLGVLLTVAVLTIAAQSGGKKTTLTYAFWGNPDAIGVEQEIIDSFEKEHPEIDVVPVVAAYNDYHTKILSMIAGGVAPDVMRIDSYYFTDFMKVNALKEISSLAKRDGFDTSVFYKQGLEECTYRGKLHGLPWGTAPFYMLLNLDVLEKAGVAVPPLNWTMDDFERIVKACTKGEGAEKTYGFSFGITNVAHILPFVWASGGDLFDATKTTFTLDKPEAARGIQRIISLYKGGYLPPELISATADMNIRLFVNNKVAMITGTAAEVLSIQKVEGLRFEAVPMPQGKSKQTSVYKSNVTGISAKTKQAEAAWKFMKFVRGPQGETIYMKAKRIPPTMDDKKFWDLYCDPTKYPKLIEQNSKAISSTYGHKLPLRAGWLEIDQTVGPALQLMFAKADVQAVPQALADLKKRVQPIMDRTGK